MTATASRMQDGLSEDWRNRPERAKLGKNDLIFRHGRHGSFLQPWDEMSRVGTGGMQRVGKPQRVTPKRSENRHLGAI
jgi:hypothetical protein